MLNKNKCKQKLPTTVFEPCQWFEPGTSGVGNNCSVNCATTTANMLPTLLGKNSAF